MTKRLEGIFNSFYFNMPINKGLHAFLCEFAAPISAPSHLEQPGLSLWDMDLYTFQPAYATASPKII